VLHLRCGQLPVVLGAARARDLHRVSFADLLDEERGEGYQRPFDARHSRDFRHYIEQAGATTIPLTFNLRGQEGAGWHLERGDVDYTTLVIRIPEEHEQRLVAQVDCQHRLGTMHDSDVLLTFQCYLGLSRTEEMAVFNIINSKAKGLSSSLLDYHTTELASTPDGVPIELFIAKRLNDDPRSVLYCRVKLGGAGTQGAQRRISLRGLQVATRLLLQRSTLGAVDISANEKFEIVRSFWQAVAEVWGTAWSAPRSHLLAKGVGVTALSLLAVDILMAITSRQEQPTADTFALYLNILRDINWSNTGPFKGYGGRQGAQQVHEALRARLFAPGLAVARSR